MEPTKCSVCGITKIAPDYFQWATGDFATGSKVNSRVCVFAKDRGKQGCINENITFNPSEAWQEPNFYIGINV